MFTQSPAPKITCQNSKINGILVSCKYLWSQVPLSLVWFQSNTWCTNIYRICQRICQVMTNINWGFMTRLSNDNNSRGDRKKSSKQLSYTKHCQIQTSSLFQINSSTSSLIYPSSIHVYKNMHTQHKRCFISLFITHNTKVLH